MPGTCPETRALEPMHDKLGSRCEVLTMNQHALWTSEMDLNSVTAEWYLGLYPPEKMPMLAVWALEQGFDGPALRELAGCSTATYVEEGGLIERALRELGKEPLDLSNAGRLLAILLCKQIVSGKTSPHEGA